MNVANIISTLGNNSSATPIFVKDGIESTAKVYLANKQGDKVSKEQGLYEAREAAIEEYGTSCLWFFTPKVVKNIFNFIAQKSGNLKDNRLLEVDSELLSGKHYQTLKDNLAKSGDKFIHQDATEIASKSKSGLQKKLYALGKTREGLGIAITIGLLAGLTILKQRITEQSINQNGTPQGLSFQRHIREKVAKHPTFAAFSHKKAETQSEPSFKGGIGNFKDLAGQAAIDAGIGGVRITTARDKDEKKEYIFKTISFILLNYGSAPIIEAGFNKLSKALKLPIGLDPTILADKDFTKNITEATKSKEAEDKMLEFVKIDPKSTGIDKEKQVIEFIDEQIAKGKYDAQGNFKGFNNATLEIALKTGAIKVENKQRAVTKFIKTEHIQSINEHLKDMINVVKQKGSPADFINKVKMTKYGAVLANIAICSAVVGVLLPKIQYKFREKGIGTVASPGVKASNQHKHPVPKANA